MYRHAGSSGDAQICASREPRSRRFGSNQTRVAQTGRHEQLRRSTAATHRELEATLQRAGFFAGEAGYRRYLGAVAPLYAALEAALDIAGAGLLLPDWPRRRKSELILAELGAEPEPEFAAAIAARLDPPQGWGAGDVLGALYVLEGATLGGAVLARQMRLCGAAGWDTRCLLDPYGSERGLLWRVFLERLETTQLTPADEVALCSRAKATFALFSVATTQPARVGSAR